MSGPMTLVDLDKVSVRAGAVRILQDVSLTVSSGDAVGIFGANGAGKTTLLRLIATLQPSAGGACSILGIDPSTAERYDVRHRIGYVGHAPGLYPELTLLENLEFVADARGIDKAMAGEALGLVGLSGAAGRRTDHCSHGMQRRAEFARIVMLEPELLLLDEPHSALDADAIDLVDGLVHRTLDRGGAAVLVSHDRDRVNSLATRTHEIKNGTLL
ncbi:MAG: heme ABC exporter ATP-binding protein CcmA [Actinomycetota bacterium]